MSDDAGSPAASDIPASAAYRIELPEFEGPLDLLLHLCKTHELDILQIPIAFVTEKYLAYLETMQAMSVEIAAEYLVMAATLAYLKARELVPNPEPLEGQGEGEEEAVDPREELIRRLLEYQKYKDAAAQLGGRPIEGRNVFGRGAKLAIGDGTVGPGPLGEHSVWKLIESFADILKKAGPKVSHEVAVDRVSLSERINQIVDRLERGGSFRFDEMVDLNASEVDVKHQLVVTLLAILELAKLRVIRVLQDQATEQFFIAHREGASLDAARRAQSTSEVDPVRDPAPDPETDSETEVASMASSNSLVDDSPTEEVRIDELPGGTTEEVPLDEAPTEEIPMVPIVPHEGLGVETVRIDPLPVEKVTPALGTPTVSEDDDEQDDESAEEDPGDKR